MSFTKADLKEAIKELMAEGVPMKDMLTNSQIDMIVRDILGLTPFDHGMQFFHRKCAHLVQRHGDRCKRGSRILRVLSIKRHDGQILGYAEALLARCRECADPDQ